MTRLTYGVGYNSRGTYPVTDRGKVSKQYNTWHGMLRRCYCNVNHIKNPTYIGCTVDDAWLDFQDFSKWYDNHAYSGFGYDLDKDILFADNKVYSPDKCCFVPQEINKLLTDREAARGDLPQGLTFRKEMNKYHVRLSVDGIRKHLGYYDYLDEAFQVYKQAKEANVKRMAIEWKDRIEDNVFQALMNWELV